VAVAQAASAVASFTERLKVASEIEAKRRESERLQVGSQLARLQATDTRVNIGPNWRWRTRKASPRSATSTP